MSITLSNRNILADKHSDIGDGYADVADEGGVDRLRGDTVINKKGTT